MHFIILSRIKHFKSNQNFRKGGLLLNNVVGIIGATAMGCSKYLESYELLIMGRFLIGVNCGKNGFYSGYWLIYNLNPEIWRIYKTYSEQFFKLANKFRWCCCCWRCHFYSSCCFFNIWDRRDRQLRFGCVHTWSCCIYILNSKELHLFFIDI